ncbi:pathogenesis-related protein PRB1-2-like [Miscanthus floridulus]|uniref:pathogenesis-related protein PRB1-2-like n=1 Tax=Miscanthus floridulus TaxID=154761 RepID=UPI003457424E
MAICAASLVSALTTAAVAKNSPEYYVELHNAARAVAGAGPVSWDGEAARHAAKRAATGCAAGLRSSRSGDTVGGVYGENVFRGTGTPGRKAWAAADAMRAWTAPAATEYAQVVWPGSDRIGCAHAVCAGEGGVVISCSYKPAGKEVVPRCGE